MVTLCKCFAQNNLKEKIERLNWLLVLRYDFENKNLAIFGGTFDNLVQNTMKNYDPLISGTLTSYDVQLEIQILN